MDPSSFNIELPLAGGAAVDGRDAAPGVDRDPAEFQRELGAARNIQDRRGRSGAGDRNQTDPDHPRDDLSSTETPREKPESGRDSSWAAPQDREPAREPAADRRQGSTPTTPIENPDARGADSRGTTGERSGALDQVAPGNGPNAGGNGGPSNGPFNGTPAPISGDQTGNVAPGSGGAGSGEAGSGDAGSADTGSDPGGTNGQGPSAGTPGGNRPGGEPGVSLPRPAPGSDAESRGNQPADNNTGRIGATDQDRTGQAERNGSGAEVRDDAPATGNRSDNGVRLPASPFEPVAEPGSGSRRTELPAQPVEERGANGDGETPRQAPPVKAPAPQPVTSPAPTAATPESGANGQAADLGTGTGATTDPGATRPGPDPVAPQQPGPGADAPAETGESDGVPRERIPFDRPLDPRNGVPAAPPPPAHQDAGAPRNEAPAEDAPIRDARLPLEPAPQAKANRPATPWEQVEQASDALRNLPAEPREQGPTLPVSDNMPGAATPNPGAQQPLPENTVRTGFDPAPRQANRAATPADPGMPRAGRSVPQPSMVSSEVAVEQNPANRVTTQPAEAEALVQRTARELGVDGGRDEATHDPRVQVEAASAGDPNKTLIQRHRFNRETEPQSARGVAKDAGGTKQAADTRNPEPAVETDVELEPELELADDAEPLNRIKVTDSRVLSAATAKGATTPSAASTPADSATLSETHATQSAGETPRGEAKAAPLPVRPSALAQTLVAQARQMPQNGSMQLRFSLQPEDLGLVRVRIDAKGGQLRIEILAQSGQALDAIQSGVARLGSSLQDAGIRDTQIDLGLDHGDSQTESDQLSQRKGDGRGSRNADNRDEQPVAAPRYVESNGPTVGGDGRLNRVA